MVRKNKGNVREGSEAVDQTGGELYVSLAQCDKQWRKNSTDGTLLARSVGNPHVVAAPKNDYQTPPPEVESTFPEPFPAYLSRNVPLTTFTPAYKPDPNSSNALISSLSLKGMRKELWNVDARARHLVGKLKPRSSAGCATGRCFFPRMRGTLTISNSLEHLSEARALLANSQGRPCNLFGRSQKTGFLDTRCIAVPGTTTSPASVSTSPYHNDEDIYRRSPGKGKSGQRVTYLLRPNVSRPNHEICTPPPTDLGYSSREDLEDGSDMILLSDRELISLSTHSLLPVFRPCIYDSGSATGVDQNGDWSVAGNDLEADAELLGDESGGRRRGPTVDAIQEELGSDSLTTEDGIGIAPRPNGMLYNDGLVALQ